MSETTTANGTATQATADQSDVHTVNGNGAKANGQAQQLVDAALGTYKQVADNVTKTVGDLRNQQSTMDLDQLRSRVTGEVDKGKARVTEARDKVSGQIGEARTAIEPTVRQTVEPVRVRIEPLYRKHVEPVYREHVEPLVKKARAKVGK